MAIAARPPVITIMGHVDHGKTTLLDYLRSSRVAAGEAGGITQHIGAYTIQHQGRALTFIDTPGHAAFSKMRQRGAEATDIIILVVAADDGVKPQTIESIRHIKNSGATPIIAINKIDLPNVYPDMVKGQLAEHDILVTGFGGDIEVVEISAKQGKNIDALLETILVTADILELTADDQAPLQAIVIEATKDTKRGSVASVIVKQGTLAVRQDIVSEEASGRVRLLTDATGAQLKEVKPGWAAEIIGFKDVPSVGSLVLDANAVYEQPVLEESEPEAQPNDELSISPGEAPSFDEIDFDAVFSEDAPPSKLTLIVRADVEGTLEAIQQNLDPDSVEVIDASVGEVTDRDLELAETTGATIIAFHVKTKARIKEQAKTRGVKLRQYDIIYKLIEDLQKQMLKLMDSSIDEVVTGEAEILQIFEMKGNRIAGVRVKTGQIAKNDKLHIKRDDQVIGDVTIKSMQHGKEVVDVVKAKNEAGITFKQNKADFRVGDILQAYIIQDE